MRHLPVLLLVSCMGVAAGAVADSSTRSFEGKITKTVHIKYVLFLPDRYADAEDNTIYPLILFLHGAGERGDDLSKIADLGPLARARRTKGFPFIVVAPQCPLGQAWRPDELIALLDEIQKQYRVNPDAVYLTGYSMGGAGTWATAMEYPDRFAAIAPLCGRAIPLLGGNLWRTPIWVFHGDKDDVVPISQSREMVEMLRGMGNKQVKFTVLKGEGHNIWKDVYSGSDVYSWFMEYRRSRP